ncbi:MAG: glucose 1-dehydrogenase [Gemmatimonadetes bacterium]|nr:glucose 1-dehydrogenase [Gemmatimonadota bacterium]MCC6774795.1 glucose 1-dehydrogenase [Gemmatimonadaceae bacterium]
MTHDLSGKTALVTGGTRGIGRAIAMALAGAGAHVIVTSRKEAAVGETVDAIRRAGHRADGIPANVGRLDELHAFADRLFATHSAIDILVNNAAANPVFGPVEQTTPEAFAKIMDVNLRAPFELAKRCLPGMEARGGGAIVNISSIGGVSPEAHLGIYSVSKAALISLTEVMAREWGPRNVRANVICPGLIKTDFSRALWGNETLLQQTLDAQPLPRMGEPDDVANLALFLASPASSFCTGGTYMVDGGYTI